MHRNVQDKDWTYLTILLGCNIIILPKGMMLMKKSAFTVKSSVRLILLVIGTIWLFFGLIAVSAALTGNIEVAGGGPATGSDRLYAFMSYTVFFILPAILLMFPYISNKRLLKLREQYSALIEVNGITDINELSKRLNKPEDVISKQIQKLKDKNLITFSTKIIAPKQKYVRCEKCSADTLITLGEPARCDYRGSPLGSE